MTTVNQICSVMRSAPADSHDNLRDVLAGLATMVNRPNNDFMHKSKTIIIDLIDEISGQIENDQIEQQQNALWLEQQEERKRHPERLEIQA